MIYPISSSNTYPQGLKRSRSTASILALPSFPERGIALQISCNKKIRQSSEVDTIIAICREFLLDFDHVNVVTALHRLATLSRTRPLTNEQISYVTYIFSQAQFYVATMSPRQLSTLVWSLATLTLKDDILLNLIADELLKVYRELNTQDISNIVWGFAVLDFKRKDVFDAITSQIVNLRGQFKNIDISIVWGYCVVDLLTEEVIETLFRVSALKVLIYKV